MKKLNPKGFSIVEVLLILVIVGIVGGTGYYIYNSQKRSTPKASTSTSTPIKSKYAPATPKPADPYAGWETYTNSELGYSFKYPKSWAAKPIRGYKGNGLSHIQIDSDNIQTTDTPIGAVDVTKGSRISMLVSRPEDHKSLMEYEQTLKETAGVVNPHAVNLGKYKGLEYVVAYEGPANLHTRLDINDSKHVDTTFDSEGEESVHPNYEVYQKILASIE